MTIMIRILFNLGLITLFAVLNACSSSIDSNTYHKEMTREQGVILQVQAVQASPKGGLTSTPVNLAHPTTQVANPVGTVGGVVVGSVANNSNEEPINEQNTLQYIVKLNDSGKIIAVVQDVKQPLRPGNHVLVLSGDGKRTEVILDQYYQHTN